MVQEMCVMPAQCKRCGAVFDLRYDFQNYDDDDFKIFSKERIKREALCWYCRKVEAVEESENEVEEIGEFLLELE